jgi:hypothetical protein
VIERGQRRRLRESRREREELLLDLGAIVYELHRQGRRAPELLQRKASQLTVVDHEVRELEAALGVEDGEPVTHEADVPDLVAELAEAEEAGDTAEVRDLEDDPAVEEQEHEHEEPLA